MKAWSVKELIEKLSQLPSNAQVYLEDADTDWIIHLFDIVTGHVEITNNDTNLIGSSAVLIRPCRYADMQTGLNFKVNK